jgi:hypothetical protein
MDPNQIKLYLIINYHISDLIAHYKVMVFIIDKYNNNNQIKNRLLLLLLLIHILLLYL